MSFAVELQDFDQVVKALAPVSDGDRRQLGRVLGRKMVSQTRRRIHSEKTSPDGTPWRDWSPGYRRRQEGRGAAAGGGKLRNVLGQFSAGKSLLENEGLLHGSIQENVTGDEITVGSDMVYAAAQQFGRPEINLPARPFLGISTSNGEELLGLTRTWFERRFGEGT